jgi:hypothetical protein
MSDARVVLASGVNRSSKRLKQRLHNMMRLLAVKEFKMDVSFAFIGKRLKKFFRQTKPERRRHILFLLHFGRARRCARAAIEGFVRQVIEAAPNKMRSSAKINHATRERLIHWHISFAGKRIARIKAGPITLDPFLISKRLHKSLPESKPTILHRVMRIDVQIAFAFEFQVERSVLRHQREHVIKETDARRDRRFSRPIDIEGQRDLRLRRFTFDSRLPLLHERKLNSVAEENKL